MLTASAVLAAAAGKKIPSDNYATSAGTPGKDNQAIKTDFKPIDVKVELARVNKQLREIQSLPVSNESKIQKQKALLDREKASAKAQLHNIDKVSSEKTSADAKDHAKHMRDAIVDFLQKLSSINPQLK